MAIKFEKVKAGDVLFDYHSEQAGNTTMRRWCNWEVEIISVHPDAEHRHLSYAIVRWNNNREQRYTLRQVERLRAKPGKEKDPVADMFRAGREARARERENGD